MAFGGGVNGVRRLSTWNDFPHLSNVGLRDRLPQVFSFTGLTLKNKKTFFSKRNNIVKYKNFPQICWQFCALNDVCGTQKTHEAQIHCEIRPTLILHTTLDFNLFNSFATFLGALVASNTRLRGNISVHRDSWIQHPEWGCFTSSILGFCFILVVVVDVCVRLETAVMTRFVVIHGAQSAHFWKTHTDHTHTAYTQYKRFIHMFLKNQNHISQITAYTSSNLQLHTPKRLAMLPGTFPPFLSTLVRVGVFRPSEGIHKRTSSRRHSEKMGVNFSESCFTKLRGLEEKSYLAWMRFT